MRSRSSSIEAIRAREFSRLDAQQLVYLDHTGSALYGESQLRAHFESLRTGVFGNPHSDSAPSVRSTEALNAARARVLRFFDGDPETHVVIFTANASAAIKLVAESYPFDAGSTLLLTADNHNSVNGIREYAARAGARVQVLGLDEHLRIGEPLDASEPGLFAFPAQSNFSGVCHPLSLVDVAKSRGFDVLLDAAAYVPTHALSLRDCRADYVALSFYKMFGYPTGIGALIARRDALTRLRRPWFAGGTVLYASVAAETHRLRDGHEAFEDGTPNFLGMPALHAGFDLLEEVGMSRLTEHVRSLTSQLLDGLRAQPHVRIYGPEDCIDRGGTVAFNVEGVPYWELEARAREQGIAIRGGCFCNPGAAERAFGLKRERIESCHEFLGDAFTPARFAACAGVPVGAVRASIGLANNACDIARLLALIDSSLAQRCSRILTRSSPPATFQEYFPMKG
jgi:selenocysteine lyase/cysteine desulfurase